MTRATAILRVVVGVAIASMAASTVAFAGEPTAANDVIRFGVMQKKFEEARDLGLFTKTTGEVNAYYYSKVVAATTTATTTVKGKTTARVVTTSLTDCGFASPKFLFGGLDPYSLIQKAEDNRASFPHLDDPYANFFAASSSDLGACANYTLVSIPTGPYTTTQYVVLFKTAANKQKYDQDLGNGVAPMPAVGFWCMWGLGNGPRPHLASPNNPQYAVYDLKDSKLPGMDSSVYIGANYWPRTHGMGSPEVLPNLIVWLDEALSGTAGNHDPQLMTPLRYESPIFLHPLERW